MSRLDELAEPGHGLTVAGRFGGYYLFGCVCGWSGRVRNENALARRSRMLGAFNDHVREARRLRTGPPQPGSAAPATSAPPEGS